MPQIINKLKKTNSWVAFDRSLMRDTRLKSNHKIIYLLFRSFAESCENVFLSYSFIAEEVGYKYSGEFEKGSEQYERAMQKFVFENLKPLLELGWVKKINQIGKSCDWEIYDHDCPELEPKNPEQKSTPTLNKKVQSNPEQKSTPSKKNIELEESSFKKEIKKEKFDYYLYIHELVEQNKIETDIADLIFDWLQTRKSKNITQRVIDLNLKVLYGKTKEIQIQILENAIKSSWTGLFEPKQFNYQPPNLNRPKNDQEYTEQLRVELEQAKIERESDPNYNPDCPF